MRQSLKTCVLVAVASGVLGVGAGSAFADAGAQGGAAGSPGVLSGNSVRAEVRAPVAACGNAADGVGLLGPALGNGCGHGAASPRPLLVARPPDGPPAAPGGHATGPEKHRRHQQAGVFEREAGRGVRVRTDHDPRMGAVARAGKSAGEALLASTGARRLGLVAGAGGGLVLGGVVLLHRARGRRG
ncbi:chaplin [Streptomyces sp. NPDC059101]|uniref:chaplin n=1 Tax=Streptomyces sp. NPDC059101 TaxID=3346728 RepID=UPI0036B89C9A